jgi:hypothetical protein
MGRLASDENEVGLGQSTKSLPRYPLRGAADPMAQ